MSPARVIAWTLLVAAGFALVAPPAAAQNPLPKKNNAAATEVRTWRDTPRGGIPKEDLKKARESFKAFAKYYAEVIAHPDVHKAPQELKAAGVIPPPSIEGPAGILAEIDQFIDPARYKGNMDPFDYLREIGAAFDAPLKELIETSPDMIVRINAARLLAHVARTGAPAHWPTITTLLADPNTPTGVKHYLFQAAGALLSAPDVQDPKIRHHMQVVNYQIKDAPQQSAQALGGLVKAIQDCINDPGLLVAGMSLDKPETLTDDQLLVVGFVRHQAVKALAKTKFVRVVGPDGKTPLYPAYTLVRIAMSDPNLLPAPKPAEVADAVIGLCNMAPAEEQLKGGFKLVKEYNADVVVEAVTAGLVTFAKPRAANAFDNTVKWRYYAAELAGALRDWRPLWDPDAEPLASTRFNAALVPPGVEALSREIVPLVLAPMDKTDSGGRPDPAARVNIEELQRRLGELRARPKRNTLLFANAPQTTIDFPPPKKPTPPEKKDPPAKDPPKK